MNGRHRTERRGERDPLYRQIYQRFRAAIAAGHLKPGDRLPSMRDLAHELGAARGTVDAAYAMLAGEGYIVGRGSRGTIVSPDLDRGLTMATTAGRGHLPDPTLPPAPQIRFLQLGLPAVDAFPRKLWAHVVGREARRFSSLDMLYPDPAGLPPLRQAIAAYLASSRGIGCDWRQVVVTNGFHGGLDLALRVLVRRRERVWIEDPCFPPVLAALQFAGAEPAPVAVDADGIRVAEGARKAPAARAAIVTPSHQFPLGVTLSLPRRLALLDWANRAGAYVVEDDYDNEFRFVGRPLPALKSLDREQRVIYAGTFSKTLFPGLRLGYLVLPDRLTDTFTSAGASQASGHAVLVQQVVYRFMTDGHFARHLKRMRNLYAARRAALVDALRAAFGTGIAIDMQPGGMHLLVRTGDRADDATLAKRAQAAGFGAEALSERALRHRCGQGLLIGFTNAAEADAPGIARRLKRALRYAG